MTEQTQPTDAEILDAADDFRSQYKHGGTTFDEFDALGFARAVLAKWGTQPQRGFVDFAGFVGWHQPVAAPFRCLPTLITEQINHLRNTAYCDGVDGEPTGLLDRVHERLGAIILTELNKARQQNAAHGVADMKGGQDVE